MMSVHMKALFSPAPRRAAIVLRSMSVCPHMKESSSHAEISHGGVVRDADSESAWRTILRFTVHPDSGSEW